MNHLRIATCIALLASGAAYADDSGPYLGASVGQAEQSEVGFEDSDTAYKLLAGYSFNRYFSVEGGYISGGSLKDTDGALDIEIKNDGYFVAGLAKLPLGDSFAVFAKLGYAFYQSDLMVTNGVNELSVVNSADDLLFGGGIEWKLGGKFQLRAEFEKVDVPDASFEIISLGATYRF